MILSFSSILCFMLIAGATLPLFVILAEGSWVGFANWITVTCTLAVIILVMARYAGYICRQDLKEIEKLEGALSANQTKEPLVDLQRLVDLHHKHKHYGEAEFYSQRLLRALSDAAQGKLVPTIASADCWLTTPAYQRSVSGKFLWLFETRGRLLLTEEKLWYWSPKASLEISIDDIVAVERVKYSWWQKPLPMYYISLLFFAEGKQHQVNLTAGPQTGTVFDINNATGSLYEKLQHVFTKYKQLARQD